MSSQEVWGANPAADDGWRDAMTAPLEGLISPGDRLGPGLLAGAAGDVPAVSPGEDET